MKEPLTRFPDYWTAIACARLPLRILCSPERYADRKQMREFSFSAYVFRMFDLFFFRLRDPEVRSVFDPHELHDLDCFVSAYDALAWRPIPTHPHISEVDAEHLRSIIAPARRLARRLWLRNGGDPIAISYRLLRGWPIWEKKPVMKKSGEPGATDNPDDAQ